MDKVNKILIFIIFISIGMAMFMPYNNGNFVFNDDGVLSSIVDCQEKKEFETSTASADEYYMDSTASTTYGTITNGPPDGMGDSTSDTTSLEEASYESYSWNNIRHETFGSSKPTGWSDSNMFYSNDFHTSTGETSAYLAGAALDTSDGAEVKFSVDLTDSTFESELDSISIYFYDSSDGQYDFMTRLFSVPTSTTVVSSSSSEYCSSSFRAKVSFSSNGGSAQLVGDDWKVDVYEPITYYRFEAVFSVTDTYYNYLYDYLNVSFGQATSSENLDFYVGWDDSTPDNLVADNKNSDFSVDISSYMPELSDTGASGSLYVKVVDDSRNGDVDQDTWGIAQMFTWHKQHEPYLPGVSGYGLARCYNLYDTDNMYAQKSDRTDNYYKFEIGGADYDGYDDFTYYYFSLYSGDEIWKVRYDIQGNSTLVTDGSSYIDAKASREWGGDSEGNLGTVTVYMYIKIDWDHSNCNNTELKCWIYDSANQYDVGITGSGDWSSNPKDIDVSTRLYLQSAISLTGGGRCDGGTSLSCSGDVQYHLSDTDHVAPEASQTDFRIARETSPGGGYSTYWNFDVDSDGTFDIEVTTSTGIKREYFTIYEWSANTDIVQTGLDYYDSIIIDKVEIYDSTSARIDTGTTTEITFKLKYSFDDSSITSGTVQMYDSEASEYKTCSYSSDYWRVTPDSRSSVQIQGFSTWNINTPEDVTEIYTAHSDFPDIIWDEVKVLGYSDNSTNGRITINDNVEYNVWIQYDYDDTNVTDGIVTVNGNSTSYSSGGNFTWVLTTSSVTSATFDTLSISGNTHGITAVNQNGKSITTIFDRIIVLGYTTNTTDGRENIDDGYELSVWIQYDYDDSNVTDGTVTVNGNSTSHSTGGNFTWTISSATVTDATYDNLVASGNYYGIDSVYQNSKSITIIWDKITVKTTVVDDSRVSTGANAEIRTTLWLEYDDSYLSSGDTVNLDDSGMNWDSTNSWFDLTVSKSSVGLWNYYVNSSSEATYGISSLNLDGNNVDVIWDEVIWESYVLNITEDSPTRGTGIDHTYSVSTGEYVNITCNFIYAYDDASVNSSTATLVSESMSFISNGSYYLIVLNNSAGYGQHYHFDEFSITGTEYGIIVEDFNSKNFTIIWDELYIATASEQGDGRTDPWEYPLYYLTVGWIYDEGSVEETGDYVKFGGVTFNYNGTYFINDTITFDSTGSYILSVNETGHYDSTYGITSMDVGSSDTITTIFDRVKIYSMWTDDDEDRLDYGAVLDVYVSLVSDYDNTSVSTGSMKINGSDLTHGVGDEWHKTYAKSEVANYTFYVTSVNWTTYDIDSINYNNYNVTYLSAVWDRIIVRGYHTNSTDNRDDINDYFAVTAWLQYEYDSTNVTDAVVELNGNSTSYAGSGNYTATFTSATVQDETIGTFVVTTDNTYGITEENQNGKSVSLIWDQVVLTDIVVSDSRIDYGEEENVTITAKLDYDDTVLGSGDEIYINGTLGGWDGTHSVFNVTFSYSSVVNYTFHVTQVNETGYGITEFTNDTYDWIIWDRLKITEFQVDDVLPDLGQTIYVNLSMVWDYDEEQFHDDNGTLHMKVYNDTWDLEEEGDMYWNDTNFQYSYDMPGDDLVVRNFNLSSWTDNVYDISVLYWNNYDNVTSGSDRVIVVSYGGNDTRDNIGDYVRVTVTLQLESNGSLITDGDVVVNDYVFSYTGADGIWEVTISNDSVTAVVFNNVVAENNTYAIETVNQDGRSRTVVFDQVVITNFWVSDSRDNINDNINISVTAILDYDDTSLGSGDIIKVNSTTTDYYNSKFNLTENYGSVVNYTYSITFVNETEYGITSYTNDSFVYAIWDRFVIYRFNTTDGDTSLPTEAGRINIGDTEYIFFGMKWDYDDETFKSDNGTIYLNETSLDWNSTEDCWSMSWSNSSPDVWFFSYNNHTDDVYDINEIYWDTYDNQTLKWDRIGVTVETNMTWTVVGYNVMVNYSSVYQSDNTNWNGYCTIANTSLTTGDTVRNENLTFTEVFNKTFYATAVSYDPNGITEFISAVNASCVWDNFTSVDQYYWYSSMTESTLIFHFRTEAIEHQYNGSTVESGWVCLNIRNGSRISSATTDSSGLLSPYEQLIPVNASWRYMEYENNMTRTLNGRTYNITWFSVVTEAQEDLQISDWQFTENNNKGYLSGYSNLDCNYTVYENDASIGETGVISDGDFSFNWDKNNREGDVECSIYFYVDATNYYWVNVTYSSFDLSISSQFLSLPPYNNLYGESNLDCNAYVYDNGTFIKTQPIVAGDFSINWLQETEEGLHLAQVKFNTSSSYEWENSSYYVGGDSIVAHINTYNDMGRHVDEMNFDFYIDGTLLGHNLFAAVDGSTYSLVVTDIFNTTIYSDTITADETIRIIIPVHVFKVYSEMQEQFVYFNMTSSGGAEYSEHLGPGEILRYYLYSDTYSYEFIKITPSGGSQLYSGTIELTSDESFIIDDVSLEDIYEAVQRAATSGGTNIKPLVESTKNNAEAISQVQLGLWILGLIIVGIMMMGNDEVKEYVGKKTGRKSSEKSGEVPEQLKPHQFKSGPENPQYKGVKEGLGKKAWKDSGVTFKKGKKKDDEDKWYNNL